MCISNRRLPNNPLSLPMNFLINTLFLLPVHDPNTVQDNKQPPVSTNGPIIGHSCNAFTTEKSKLGNKSGL